MLHNVRLLLWSIGPFFAAVASQQTNPFSLPVLLQNTVPSCAHECLALLVAQTLPPLACLSPEGIDCLCSRYGITGFTIGELALACLTSSCPLEVVRSSISVYAICEDKEGSARPTHDVITISSITAFATSVQSRDPRETGGVDLQTSILASTSANADFSSSLAPSSSSASLSDPGVQPTSVSSLRPPPSSSELEGRRVEENVRALTTAQIVGITSAVASLIILMIGAIVLAARIRRRRTKPPELKEEKLEFGVNHEPYPRSPGPPDPKHDTPERKMGVLGDDNAALEKGWSWTQANVKAEGIGLALSPEMDYPQTPPSAASSRTMSKLLPEKPDTTKAPKFAGRISEATENTVFEEDRRSLAPPTVKSVPNSPASQTPSSGNRQKPPNPHYPPLRDPEVERQHPSLSLRIPHLQSGRSEQGHKFGSKQHGDSQELESLALCIEFPAPPNVDLLQSRHSSLGRESIDTRSSGGYLPDYYFSSVPKDDSAELGASADLPPRQNHVPRASEFRRAPPSYISDTSIESTFSQEETPPEDEAKQLSPVVESPIAGLRYPKVPRSSNQLVARKSMSPAQSPTKFAITMAYPASPPAAYHNLTPSIQESNHPSFSSRASISRLSVNLSTNPATERLSDHSPGHGSMLPQSEKRIPRLVVPTSSRVNGDPMGLALSRTEMELRSPLWVPESWPKLQGGDLFFSAT